MQKMLFVFQLKRIAIKGKSILSFYRYNYNSIPTILLPTDVFVSYNKFVLIKSINFCVLIMILANSNEEII